MTDHTTYKRDMLIKVEKHTCKQTMVNDANGTEKRNGLEKEHYL